MTTLSVRLVKAKEALETYDWPLPFPAHLKEHFKKNKNAGSRDRKAIRQLCYQYFRLAPALESVSEEDKWLISACFFHEHTRQFADIEEATAERFLGLFEAEDEVARLAWLKAHIPGFALENILPHGTQLAAEFKNDAFFTSFLSQPLVWIKIKKGKEHAVKREIEQKGIAWKEIESERIIGFNPESKLDETDVFKKGFFRIQDLSSQSTSELFRAADNERWWDACCGAGGKSLALLDATPGVRLWASDVRESIISNLRERLKVHGYRYENTFVADLRRSDDLDVAEFDGIILDAPCSGSGTWARSPENLLNFPEGKIAEYAALQYDILTNAWKYLKAGKPLIYITCSVYRQENEDVISRFVAENAVEIEEQKYLKGYLSAAENMFICRMIKK